MNVTDIDQGDSLWMTSLRSGSTCAVTVLEVDTTTDRVHVIDEDGQVWAVSAGFLSRRR